MSLPFLELTSVQNSSANTCMVNMIIAYKLVMLVNECLVQCLWGDLVQVYLWSHHAFVKSMPLASRCGQCGGRTGFSRTQSERQSGWVSLSLSLGKGVVVNEMVD